MMPPFMTYMQVVNHLVDTMRCCECSSLYYDRTIYACAEGHIVCDPCVCSLLANENLGIETAYCPKCPIKVNSSEMMEYPMALSIMHMLPIKCFYCRKSMTYGDFLIHGQYECKLRKVSCMYENFGCKWTGLYNDRQEHELTCRQSDVDPSTYLVMNTMFTFKIWRKFNKKENFYFFNSEPVTAFDAVWRLYGEMQYPNEKYLKPNVKRLIIFSLMVDKKPSDKSLRVQFYQLTATQSKNYIFDQTFRKQKLIMEDFLLVTSSTKIDIFLAKEATYFHVFARKLEEMDEPNEYKTFDMFGEY